MTQENIGSAARIMDLAIQETKSRMAALRKLRSKVIALEKKAERDGWNGKDEEHARHLERQAHLFVIRYLW